MALEAALEAESEVALIQLDNMAAVNRAFKGPKEALGLHTAKQTTDFPLYRAGKDEWSLEDSHQSAEASVASPQSLNTMLAHQF